MVVLFGTVVEIVTVVDTLGRVLPTALGRQYSGYLGWVVEGRNVEHLISDLLKLWRIEVQISF